MTIPRFLQSTFHFNQDMLVTDVNTIITTLTTILTGQAPAWTNPSAGVFESPVDAAGRFMKIVVARTTQQRLAWQVFDQNDLPVASREIDIDLGGNPTTVNYYSGQYHLYLETLVAPTPEWAGAFMIDPTGYALNNLQNYVMGNAYRSSGGAVDGQGSTWDQWFMIDNAGTPTVRERIRAVSEVPGNVIGLLDFSGSPQFFPVDVFNAPSGLQLWVGSAYQCYQTASQVPGQTLKPVAIDNATAANFRATVAGTPGSQTRLMIRVP